VTFERLKPKNAGEVLVLQAALDSLSRNDRLLQRQFGKGLLQIEWPGHYFGVLEPSELIALKEAMEFELMCWGASERKVYL
jgi:hypothetical protein